MLGWLRKLLQSAQVRSDRLEKLEQQAHIAKNQLNHALDVACSFATPEAKVQHLELAKFHFAELQAIATEHPRMRLKNEQEVSAAIEQLEQAFARAGYDAMVRASRGQSVSTQVTISPTARELLR